MPKIIFQTPDGVQTFVEVEAGTSVLEAARNNDIDIEGVCEGVMACSTCHVIVAGTYFGRLPPPSEEEQDLLDLAWGLQPTSRLGCQVVVTEDIDGMELFLPSETNNQM